MLPSKTKCFTIIFCLEGDWRLKEAEHPWHNMPIPTKMMQLNANKWEGHIFLNLHQTILSGSCERINCAGRSEYKHKKIWIEFHNTILATKLPNTSELWKILFDNELMNSIIVMNKVEEKNISYSLNFFISEGFVCQSRKNVH